MNNELYLKRIEAYFEEQMSVEEKNAFESELKTSPELLEATEKYKISRQAIDLLSERALRSKLKDWRKKKKGIVTINEPLEKSEPVAKTDAKVRKLWSGTIRKLAVAASFILLATAAYIIVPDYFSNTENTYITSFYTPSDDERARNAEDPNWKNAYDAFTNENYEDASVLFQKINPTNDVTEFYLAQSFFHLENYESAKEFYQKILDREDTSYREEAEWNHLVSSFLLNKNDKAAKAKLDEINSNPRHSFYPNAKELKEKLEK